MFIGLPKTEQPTVTVNRTGQEDLNLMCSAKVPSGWNVTFAIVTPTNETASPANFTSYPDGNRSAVYTVANPVPTNLTGWFTCVMKASANDSTFSSQWTIRVIVYGEDFHCMNAVSVNDNI